MFEWHITPEYIFANWTDEEFALMIEKCNQRRMRELEPPKGGTSGGSQDNMVSDDTMIQMLGDKVKWRKPDGN